MMEFSKPNIEIVSVSQYLDKVNLVLRGQSSKIVGEICAIQMYEGRSYLYFSIKDKKDQSTVKCFMWKNDLKISGVNLRDGLEIIISAYPSIYKPNGGLSLQVETIELVGEGALQLAYEELKKKLTLEGLFLESRKREIPSFPQKIGLITSKSGAVINDFLSNIGKFGFEISFVDSKVEGADAIKDLLAAIKTLKNKDLDVLVIMRGGGSLESFLAFNNEILVREVANFPVPVLTGIGHDKDAPLMSLISDKNVSTPTAVANLLNSTWKEVLSSVNLYGEKIFSYFQSSIFDTFRLAEDTLLREVDSIGTEIKLLNETLSYNKKDLVFGFENIQKQFLELLKQSQQTIELSNPERQLAHGYSIIKNKGKIIKSTKQIQKGDELDIMVSDGIIHSKTI
jgi:exodeoxyribonuclease VII large subunit